MPACVLACLDGGGGRREGGESQVDGEQVVAAALLMDEDDGGGWRERRERMIGEQLVSSLWRRDSAWSKNGLLTLLTSITRNNSRVVLVTNVLEVE